MFNITHETQDKPKRRLWGWLILVVIILVASVLMNGGQPDEAAWAASTKAMELLQQEDYTNALTSINKAIELNPKDIENLYIRSLVYLWLNRYEEALTDINKVLQQRPGDVYVLYSRCTILRAMERYEEALADANAMLQRDTENMDGLYVRSAILLGMRRYEDALADANKMLDIKPDKTDGLYARSNILLVMKKYEGALADANRMLEQEPRNAEGFNVRYSIFLAMKQYEEALEDANEAILLEPDNMEYLENRVFIYKRLKRYKAALEDIQIMRGHDPENARYNGLVGMMQYHLHQYDQAYNMLNDALKTEITFDYLFRYRGLCAMALLQKENGTISKEGVLNDLDRAIDTGRENCYNYLARAEYYLWQQENDRALADIKTALVLDELEPETYHLFADYYQILGDADQAAKYQKLAEEHGYISEP